MKHNIVVLYNTYSGRGKGKKMASALSKMLSDQNTKHVLFENNWPEHIDDYSWVWVVGGDGTMNFFLNFYKVIPIPVSLFPGGTGNDIHWKLYGQINLNSQVDFVLNQSIRKIDIGLVNSQRFINMIGLGFDGEVLKSVQTARWIGGHLGYLVIVLKKIFTYKELLYTLEMEGKPTQQRKCLLFLVANSERTGGGFFVSPLSDIEDGRLNLITASSLSWWQRILLLIKVEKGQHIGHPAVQHEYITALKVVSEKTVYYQLDGELKSDREFKISTMKGWLDVV